MPYRIENQGGSKPWKIINDDTNEIVGSSDSEDKAKRSVGYRMAAEGTSKDNEST